MATQLRLESCARTGSALERDPLRTKPHTHAGWYVSHPHILLSGGADTNPDRLAAFGADWSLPADRLFAAYRDLLATVQPDLLIDLRVRAGSRRHGAGRGARRSP